MSAPPQPPRPLGRILRGAEAKAYADAAGALQLAQARADALIAEARAAAAQHAETIARRRIEAAEAEAVALLGQAQVELQAMLRELEPAIAEAIADGVARILGRMPSGEALADAARHAARSLQDRAALRVVVAPAHAAHVSAALPGVAVDADATLSPDELVLDGAAGVVHAGLSAQLERLRAALLARA